MTSRSKKRRVLAQRGWREFGTTARMLEGIMITILPGKMPLSPEDCFLLADAVCTAVKLSGSPPPALMQEARDYYEQALRGERK